MNGETEKLEEGSIVTINIPFVYQIGDTGYHTNKVLETLEDVKNEFWADLQHNIDTGVDFCLDISVD